MRTETDEERRARWDREREERFRKYREDLAASVVGKRFRLTRRCVCPPDNMGWGCCCAKPLGVKEDPEGDFVLVPYEGD